MSQGHYATKTEVPADRSRAEIERLLVRYGATGFMYAWEGESQVIAFKIHDRYIRIILPMPDPADFQLTGETRRRHSAECTAADLRPGRAPALARAGADREG